MKTFVFDVDFVFSENIYVTAENEEEAKETLDNIVWEDPRFASRHGVFVKYEVIDCNEEKE